MNRTDRELRRKSAETAQQARMAAIRELHYVEQEKSAKVSEVLAKAVCPVKEAVRNSGLDTLLDEPSLSHLLSVAPKLTEPRYLDALRRILVLLPKEGRPLTEWKPKGKGRDTQFRSLCDFLLAKYKTPPFLYNLFFDEELAVRGRMGLIGWSLGKAVVYVAGGGSLYDRVQDKTFPVPFTRKMCHEFLKTTVDFTFIQGIRRTQILSLGGGHRLVQVVLNSCLGRELYSPADEAFWATVLQWLAHNPMLNPAQVEPIFDYLTYRRRADPMFSMKGRSVLAVIRGMEEWHGELSKAKNLKADRFLASGFRDKIYRIQVSDDQTYTWTIEEVLTPKALLEEGRVLKHCVYSYASSIEDKRVSIWSMSLETNSSPKVKVLTIEVWNNTRTISQVRGKLNRKCTSEEYKILRTWAGENQLTISSHSV